MTFSFLRSGGDGVFYYIKTIRDEKSLKLSSEVSEAENAPLEAKVIVTDIATNDDIFTFHTTDAYILYISDNNLSQP